MGGSTRGTRTPVQTARKLYRVLPLDSNKLPLVAGEDLHRQMRFAPKPALPTPSSGACIWNNWHDPYMGAECLLGRGERSRPFPWLNGGPIAEPPKWLDHSVKDEGRGGTVKDPTSICEISQDKAMDDGTTENKGRSLGFVAPITPPTYEIWSRLPYDLDEFDRFDRDIGPIILKIEDCTDLFASAIINYVKENLPSLMKSYSFDPRTGQPGPHIDIMRIISLVNENESVRLDIGEDVSELTNRMTRYVATWDMVLKLRREIYALEARQVILLRKKHDMKTQPENYTETERNLNTRKQMENNRELDDRLRHLSNGENGVAKCAKALYECKNKMFPRIWHVLQAHDKWIEANDMCLTSGPFVWHSVNYQTTDDHGLPVSEQPQTPERLSDMCLDVDVGEFDTIF